MKKKTVREAPPPPIFFQLWKQNYVVCKPKIQGEIKMRGIAEANQLLVSHVHIPCLAHLTRSVLCAKYNAPFQGGCKSCSSEQCSFTKSSTGFPWQTAILQVASSTLKEINLYFCPGLASQRLPSPAPKDCLTAKPLKLSQRQTDVMSRCLSQAVLS